MLVASCLLLIAFVAIWLATEHIIAIMERTGKYSRLSRFALSLFVLGTITSFPEIAITFNSLLVRAPQIALGNLIGSQIFLLFLVIPVLALVTKGLRLDVQQKKLSVTLTLLVTLVPMLGLINQTLDTGEVLMALGAYAFFIVTFIRQDTFRERIQTPSVRSRQRTPVMVLVKLGLSMAVVVLAANTAVRQIIEIAAFLQTPRFLLSLVLLPLGTNLPELSLALHHLVLGKKSLALADYLGALTFNSALIALLMFANRGSLYIGQNISLVIAVFILGLLLFGWFAFSREKLSVKEGLVLLVVYLLVLTTAGWQSSLRM